MEKQAAAALIAGIVAVIAILVVAAAPVCVGVLSPIAAISANRSAMGASAISGSASMALGHSSIACRRLDGGGKADMLISDGYGPGCPGAKQKPAKECGDHGYD